MLQIDEDADADDEKQRADDLCQKEGRFHDFFSTRLYASVAR